MRAQAAVEKAMSQFQAGDAEGAKRTLRAHLQREPSEPNVNKLLGMVHAACNEWPQALFHIGRAADASPKDAELRFMHGNTLYQLAKFDEAAKAIDRALAIDPGHVGATQIAVKLLFAAGRFEEAFARIRRAIEHAANPAELYRDSAVMLQEIGRTAEATGLLREAVERFPGDARLLVQACYSFNFVDADAGKHAEMHRKAGEMLAPGVRGDVLVPPPPGALRVGVLSSDLSDHACGTFMMPLLPRLMSQDIELYLYSTTAHADSMTQKFSGMGQWRDVRDASFDDIAAKVAADHVHVLIETNGWTAGTRLAGFSRRLAPVQATWLGYPNTTGVPSMDVRLVDAVTDPPGAEALASERLVRVEGCFLCYQGRPGDPAPEARGGAVSDDAPITFGSFNRISKISDRAAGAWSRVLNAVPGSRLLLKARVQSEALRAAYAAKFAPHGVDAGRIVFSPYAPDHHTHLTLYNEMDIALDCFPYNGTTTTCEALWMGVPVVTVVGETHRARVGASLLAAAGYGELVAENEDDFVRVATGLAGDRAALRAMKAAMRARVQVSMLCDADGYASRFAAALRSVWGG
ncbi:MAG: tetratricopeptide repeat protein [Phycisphaerales bacterium]|jgi:predicted O-linked N-acetylglucosamine transferase (SPINDLY family)